MKPSILLFFSLVILTVCSDDAIQVDTVLFNGKIYAVDDGFSRFEAMSIKDGKVVELGANEYILQRYQAESKIDAKGKSVYPGFIDAHCHFLGYGRALQRVNLVGTKSWEEVVRVTVDHAKKYPAAWVQGRGWDQSDWELKDFPHRALLDLSFPNTPVLLRRIDGHAAMANKVALDRAGIFPGMQIEGGEVVVEDRSLTGLLLDKAVDLVLNVIPPTSQEQDVLALLEAQSNCFEVGLTTVDDAGLLKDEVLLIDSLQNAGVLKMRLYAMLSDVPENYEYFLPKGPYKTDRLHVGAFKLYADGALGSRGACLLSPYSDVIHQRRMGYLLDSVGHFQRVAKQVYDRGFQLCSHCIGDSANRVMLDVYSELLGGENDRRWRIEHAQVVHKADIGKFGANGVVPSVQPTHATSDMYWAEQRLGRNRVRRAYAYQELLQQLGKIALGTDFPVEGINPVNTFYAATVRKDSKNFPQGGFLVENALSREEALRGMTIWAAWSNFEEGEKGSLEPGKYADLVILNQDIMEVVDSLLLDTRVELTLLGGEIVYQR